MSMFTHAMFLELMETVQKNVHQNSRDKGFWDGEIRAVTIIDSRTGEQEVLVKTPANIPEKLALIHSEISEALEAHRSGNPPCDKQYMGGPNGDYPVKLNMSAFAEEMADAVIRIMDLCEFMKIDLGAAIIEKHNYNKTRPHKHGKAY